MVIDAAAIRAWASASTGALAAARRQIDALNVFPVPDGDTGTNVYLTMEGARAAVAECPEPDSLGPVAAALARGALLGARGNSGVILSQYLRGFIDHEGFGAGGLGPAAVADALRRAADASYAAVSRPVEGTILTVARGAAERAGALANPTDAAAVLAAACAGAREALADTPRLLERLRTAGVVDAGGQALVIVLESLLAVLTGADLPVLADSPPALDLVDEHYGGPAYEVMFLLEAEQVEELKAELEELGDSLVVVGGDGLWNVHVHVDDAGAAIEAAIGAGRPHRIRITHLQVTEGGSRAVVAVTHGPGIARLLQESGVTIVPAQPRQRPSTAEMIAAIESTHAREVVVLPSDTDSMGVAELAAQHVRTQGVRASVVPTRSVVQTLAAVAVQEPEARFEDDVASMARAAGATRYGAVTIASKEALTTVGPCRPGDVLGLIDGDIAAIGADQETVARELLGSMLAAGGELVTLVLGSEAGPELVDGIPRWLEAAFPVVEVVVHRGGQPLWPLILGVE